MCQCTGFSARGPVSGLTFSRPVLPLLLVVVNPALLFHVPFARFYSWS